MQLDNHFTLEENDIRLSILKPKDETYLTQVAQDPRIWVHNPVFTNPTEFREKWFNKALSQMATGSRIVFVIQYQHHIIGSTSFYDIKTQEGCLTMGYTWLHPDYWGKGINTIVKKLLLDYIFSQPEFNQVNFAIDILNQRSRAAVLKLGARETGIIRNHMVRPDGSMRDSIVYN